MLFLGDQPMDAAKKAVNEIAKSAVKNKVIKKTRGDDFTVFDSIFIKSYISSPTFYTGPLILAVVLVLLSVVALVVIGYCVYKRRN